MKLFVAASLASLAVAFAAAEAPTVTGTWNMGVQGDHVIRIALVLKQQDKKVTGTIALPVDRSGQRVDVELTGEFVDGALKLSGRTENASEPTTVAIAGTLKEDGSLEGTLSAQAHGQHHELPWTAERLKERQ
jgi:hypothetical protein